jgi:two-component system OmpR family sensor kinase/two-component system sensor histidine kinase QseC
MSMNSIRARLLAALVAALLLAAAAIGGLVYWNVLRETEALFDYQMRQMALSLRDQGEIGVQPVDSDAGFDYVVQIWTADGRAIYATSRYRALPSRAVLGFADIEVQSVLWRTYSAATRERVIQVAQPHAVRRHLAAQAALRSVTPLAAIAPLLAIVMAWLLSIALRPLARVAREVRARDAESLALIPMQGLPDEVSPLVGALNRMLQRLAQSFGAQRTFVADAAHELRSPLTALRLQIGALGSADDAASRGAAIESLRCGIERAVRLVEQLLTLARSERGAPAAPTQRVDLSELVRQVIADTAPAAFARGSDFEFDAETHVELDGDPAALAALARNLAENAVLHAPAGARVRVRVWREAGVPVLSFDDSGPGIAEAERERVFDRFYRPGGGSADGSGLGLAIVRSVAERHGATVTLGDSALGGLRVVVRFEKGSAPP